MITDLARTRSVVGNTVVQRTSNNNSERMSRAWHTHCNSTTVKTEKGTLRVESACESFVESAWAPLMVGRVVRQYHTRAAAWDSACLLLPATEGTRGQERHSSSANVLPELSRPHAGRGLGWRLDSSVESA
jgi:hypothetical protein